MVLDDSTQTISSSIDDLVSADISTESIQPETQMNLLAELHKRKSVSDDMDNNPEAKKRSKRMFKCWLTPNYRTTTCRETRQGKAELADRIKKEREAVIEKRRLTEQNQRYFSSPGVYFMPANHNDRTKRFTVSAITVKTEAVSNADQPSSHTSIISV
ncbi:hypothetical protein BSLG_005949 [Batrachochytrium salamandrivorans]|nr:hypothetical protein BSLG_005949 [Batrachochytrium salamandrivorans]